MKNANTKTMLIAGVTFGFIFAQSQLLTRSEVVARPNSVLGDVMIAVADTGDPPPPSPCNVQVTVNGRCCPRKFGTYTASASGGTGNYTYQWMVNFDGGGWQDLGNGASQRIDWDDRQCTAVVKRDVTDTQSGCKASNAISISNPDC